MKRRIRQQIEARSTGVLVAMDGWLDGLPLWAMSELRAAIKEELLARSLGALADSSGGFPVHPVPGVN